MQCSFTLHAMRSLSKMHTLLLALFCCMLGSPTWSSASETKAIVNPQDVAASSHIYDTAIAWVSDQLSRIEDCVLMGKVGLSVVVKGDPRTTEVIVGCRPDLKMSRPGAREFLRGLRLFLNPKCGLTIRDLLNAKETIYWLRPEFRLDTSGDIRVIGIVWPENNAPRLFYGSIILP
jgi:hypothetical protein